MCISCGSSPPAWGHLASLPDGAGGGLSGAGLESGAGLRLRGGVGSEGRGLLEEGRG